MVMFILHDLDVFLVDLGAGEAAGHVVFHLMVGIQVHGRGPFPGVGQGLHAQVESFMFDDHLMAQA